MCENCLLRSQHGSELICKQRPAGHFAMHNMMCLAIVLLWLKLRHNVIESISQKTSMFAFKLVSPITGHTHESTCKGTIDRQIPSLKSQTSGLVIVCMTIDQPHLWQERERQAVEGEIPLIPAIISHSEINSRMTARRK